MKVNIEHVEKISGVVFRKRLHGVALSVKFSEEEHAIITQRGLERDMVLERGVPADVNAEKHEKRGMVKKLATAAVMGRDANHYHLTIGKLLQGTDTFFFDTPLEAKTYEQALHEVLPEVKEYIMGNESIEKKSGSFEL